MVIIMITVMIIMIMIIMMIIVIMIHHKKKLIILPNIPTHNNEGFHIETSLADCIWAWYDSGLYRQHLHNTTQLLGWVPPGKAPRTFQLLPTTVNPIPRVGLLSGRLVGR